MATLLSLLLAMLTLVPAASAQTATVDDCDTGDAPAAFGSSCNSTCTFTSANSTLECSLSACGGASSATIVTDYNGTGNHDFAAFGDCNGTSFCCTVDDASSAQVGIVSIVGSAYDDVLAFKYSATDYLRPHRASTSLAATISGDAGDDYLKGSESASSYFAETLHGNDGVDLIEGNAGADIIFGDAGNDGQIFGGGLHGGDGDDEIHGGTGLDDCFGDNGDDTIHGDDGIDSLWGGGRGRHTVR